MQTDSTASTPRPSNEPVVVDMVVVVRSPDGGVGGKTVPLTAHKHDLGRRADVAGPLLFADLEVSRRHASLELDEASNLWRVVDHGSRNGTLLNGERVDRAELRDGDVLRVGSSLLVFRRIEDLETAAAALLEDEPSPGGPELQRVRLEIARTGRDAAPVLILGESGVGKEHAAVEVHRVSGRSGQLVTVDCAGLQESLAEAELYGVHDAGAGGRDGAFARAEHGTLFFDEIAELPAALQSSLLRAVSAGEIRAVGAAAPRPIDVRIVAANSHELRDEVVRGSFRSDLFGRLAGWLVRIPPLRRRREDVLPLVAKFLGQRGAPCAIDADAAEALLLYDWPFNVRELEYVVTVAVARAPGEILMLEHLPPELRAPIERRRRSTATQARHASRPRLAVPLEESEPPTNTYRTAPPSGAGPSNRPDAADVPSVAELQALVERFSGNVQGIANELGRDRRQIYRWLERHGIEAADYRIPPEAVLRAELERFGGNVARVSAALGTNRMQVYRWLRRYRIEVAEYRPPDAAAR